MEKPLYRAMGGQEGLAKLYQKAWYHHMLVENVLAWRADYQRRLSGALRR